MKKCWWILLLLLLLSGCAAPETLETVEDEWLRPVMAPVREVTLVLPENASMEVVHSDDGGTLYLCDDYFITVQTLPAGDRERTFRTLCGFTSDRLTVMETQSDALHRYDWVWTAASEAGDQVGRAAVLDDGSYHYCVSVMAAAEACGGLEGQWDALFQSINLAG